MELKRQTSNVKRTPPGVVAILSVLIITAILIAIGISIAALGQNEIVLSGLIDNGEKAFSIADACSEEGLARLKSDAAFTGTTFPLDNGTCTVVVTNLGGNVRLITGTGAFRDAVRSVVANVTITFNGAGNAKKTVINSWNEAD